MLSSWKSVSSLPWDDALPDGWLLLTHPSFLPFLSSFEDGSTELDKFSSFLVIYHFWESLGNPWRAAWDGGEWACLGREMRYYVGFGAGSHCFLLPWLFCL